MSQFPARGQLSSIFAPVPATHTGLESLWLLRAKQAMGQGRPGRQEPGGVLMLRMGSSDTEARLWELRVLGGGSGGSRGTYPRLQVPSGERTPG